MASINRLKYINRVAMGMLLVSSVWITARDAWEKLPDPMTAGDRLFCPMMIVSTIYIATRCFYLFLGDTFPGHSD